LLVNVFELGPIIVLGYAGILEINHRPLKYTLIITLSIITFFIPIFFNPLLGWLWFTINPMWFDKCQVNKFGDLFQFNCFTNGMVPFGSSIIVLNFLIIGIIYTCYKCDKCCGKLRKDQNEEHDKLIRVT